jgi:hypothetical protein
VTGKRGFVAEGGEINEIIDLVKTYAKQETIEPLRNTGRYLARGAAGGFLIAFGLILLLVGLLRVLQTETDVFDDGWSFVPYFIVVLVGGLIAAIFVSRISKGGLDG